MARFLRVYLILRAYRLGVAGIVAATEKAIYVFQKHAKLWEMSIEPESQESSAYPLEKPETPDE